MRRKTNQLVDIEGIVVHDTPDAYLFKWDADKDAVWIPKSVAEIDDNRRDAFVTMTLPSKMAEDKGML